MPTDPVFWIVAIAVVAAVIAFAIWRGRNSKLKISQTGIDFENAAPKETIRVANEAKLDGKIRVIKGESSDQLDGDTDKEIVVGERMSVGEKAVIDEIVGREVRRSPKKSP